MGSIRDGLEDEAHEQHLREHRRKMRQKPDRWAFQGMWVVDLQGDAAFRAPGLAEVYCKALNDTWRENG